MTVKLSWAELTVPASSVDRGARVSWAELEVPSTSERQCEISWAEIEVPSTNNRCSQVSWAEMEVPSIATNVVISNLIGFETGGFEEAVAKTGSPAVNSTRARSGIYSLKMGASDAHYKFFASEHHNFDDEEGFFLEFYINFDTLTPSSSTRFLYAVSNWPGETAWAWQMFLNTDNTITINDVSSPRIVSANCGLQEDTWHKFQIYWTWGDSGEAIYLYVDDNLKGSSDSCDTATGSGSHVDYTQLVYIFRHDGSALPVYYVDDIVTKTDCQDQNARFSTDWKISKGYQNTVEDNLDQGSTLDDGTWADASELPFSDNASPDLATYTDSGDAGHMRTDEGARSGPASDIDGTPVAAKFLHRMEFNNTNTPVYQRIGKYTSGGSDSFLDADITPTTDPVNYKYITESPSYVPQLVNDYFVLGMKLQATNEIYLHEAVAFLLQITSTNRRAQVSWAEMETPAPQRGAQVSWAEMEVPTLTNRQAFISWVEMETPDAPRGAQVSWAEMEVPSTNARQVEISWAQMEVPGTGEPSGTKFPFAYDDEWTLLGNLIDQRNFRLKSSVGASNTTIEVEGSLADIDLPVYVTWGDGTGEIMYCDEINEAQTSFTGVIRGVRNTNAASHTAGASCYLAVVGLQFYLLMDAILAAEKFQSLVGTSANKPTSVEIGEVFTETDTDTVYGSIEDDAWQLIGRTHHNQLGHLEANDHPNLHNDYRAYQWHDTLSGEHVTDGDEHDHFTGDGPQRIYGGTSLPGSPTYEREYFYDETNDELYISKDTSTWVRVSGAPSGAIMMISEATAALYGGDCPPGWSRFTPMDERIPVGAPSSKPPGLGNVGSDTHDHTYSTVIAHSHPVPAFSAIVGNLTTNHTHTVPAQTPGGSGLCLATGSIHTSSFISSYSGNHSHAFTVPATVTNLTKRTSDDASGVSQGTTESGSSLPPYHTVIFCEKD